MKLLSDWGFSSESWKGSRGEYWVLMQAVLMVGFLLLPVYRPAGVQSLLQPPLIYGVWAVASLLFLLATLLVVRGLIDLGASLTPLPYPKDAAELVQTGIYGLVRHPLYSGIITAAAAYAIGQLSLTHGMAMLVLLLFFNFKASREETWLKAKHADYANYQQRVKKLVPWVM
jgi:protein-S-isoprenylcysteine O-methyltransferase Ste14